MGTTAAYYCIWNRGFTQDELKEKLKGISGSGKKEDDEFFQTLCRMCSPKVARQIWDDAEKARADFHAALWGKDQTQRDCATIAYKPDAKWLPLFETKLCEGYIASSRDATRLSKLFAAPVLAFSVFDSDILFVSYSDAKKKIRRDYAKPNSEEIKEYDTEQYNKEFPEFLSEFCDRDELKAIWDHTNEIFAEDRLEKLCRIMKIDLLYDGACALDGYQLIT